MHLHCLATGTPPPVVRWYYIGPVWSEHVKNSIHNGSAYRVHNNGTLVIGSITEKNVGFYECAASNVIGTATKKAGIYLPGKFAKFCFATLKRQFYNTWEISHASTRGKEPVARSMFSANQWLRDIETYTFLWYLTLVIASYASKDSGQTDKKTDEKLNLIVMMRQNVNNGF